MKPTASRRTFFGALGAAASLAAVAVARKPVAPAAPAPHRQRDACRQRRLSTIRARQTLLPLNRGLMAVIQKPHFFKANSHEHR